MIRPYHPTDQDQLLHLLRLNTPQYFAPSEEEDYKAYLVHSSQYYFVMEEAGQVVGCGGYNFPDGPTIARISWDIIHPDFQGRGIGKQLTLHRINEIRKKPAVDQIIVRTSQLAFRFYEKLGFVLEKTEKDYWAEGYDLYWMRMAISSQ